MKRSIAVLFTAAITTAASANILTFDLDWSGASFGNGATAVGQISIDDTLMNNPGSTDIPGTPGFVTAFSITVSGSAGGDGTFGLADFAVIFLDTGGLGLDLTQELVGQPTGGNGWGTPDTVSGDFNIFSSGASPLAPNGSFYFEITAAGGTGEQMLLTSFRPVPAPGSAALLGIGGLMAVRRRRSN